MKTFYKVSDLALVVIHGVIIIFTLFGWILPATRLAHLCWIVVTLCCWYVLGIWFGMGYCPVTDLQWRLKKKMGIGRPEKTFVQFWLERITRRAWTIRGADCLTEGITMVSGAISLALNVRRWI